MAIRYKSPTASVFEGYDVYNTGITTTGTYSSSSAHRTSDTDQPYSSMYHTDTQIVMASADYQNERIVLDQYEVIQKTYTQDLDSMFEDNGISATETVMIFRLETAPAGVGYQSPRISFDSPASGYIRVYDTSGSVVGDETLSNVSFGLIPGTTSGYSYWIQVHLTSFPIVTITLSLIHI